jgi:hypothetical protein
MSEAVRLTPAALESLLEDLDHDAFVGFVADLYARGGRTTDRTGDHILVSTANGENERILVWTDDRGRIERLGREQPDTPETPTDAVVTRGRDASTAALIADEHDARLVETADLHDRLLYAIDRETCRGLCRDHLGQAVDPVPGQPDPTSEGAATVPPSLTRLLAVVALCGVVLATVAALPGITLPGEPTADAGVPAGTPVGPGAVTPVGGGTTPTEPPTPQPTPAPQPTPVCTDCPAVFYQSYARSRTVSAGGTMTIEATVSDTSLAANITGGWITVEPPGAWNVTSLILGIDDYRYPPINTTTVGVRSVGPPLTNVGVLGSLVLNVARGDWTTEWNLAVPESVDGGRYNVSLVSAYRTEGGRSRVRENVTVAVKPAGCREPCGLLSQTANGSGEFDPPGSPQGENGSTVTGVLYNPYPYNLTNGTIRLAPDRPNWTLTPVNGTSFDVLGPGDSQAVAWNLSYDGPPSKYPPPNRYTGTVTYTRANGTRVTVPITYTGEVFPPYLS